MLKATSSVHLIYRTWMMSVKHVYTIFYLLKTFCILKTLTTFCKILRIWKALLQSLFHNYFGWYIFLKNFNPFFSKNKNQENCQKLAENGSHCQDFIKHDLCKSSKRAQLLLWSTCQNLLIVWTFWALEDFPQFFPVQHTVLPERGHFVISTSHNTRTVISNQQ